MTEVSPQESSPKPRFPAQVIAVIDDHRVVINRGSRDGLKPGTRVIVYGLSRDDLKDPETGENLGRLEIVRGLGMVVHLQETMATVKSTLKAATPRTIIRRSPWAGITGLSTEEETVRETPETLPFDGAQIGDFVRPA